MMIARRGLSMNAMVFSVLLFSSFALAELEKTTIAAVVSGGEGDVPHIAPAGPMDHHADIEHFHEDVAAMRQSSLGFWHAFLAAFSVIIVSELGDKTFFIAAIMAMRHSRLVVFAGCMVALAVMHMLSTFLGYATQIIPRKFTYYISTALFALFGLKMLKEAYSMSPDEAQEEFDEAQAEIRKKDDEYEKGLIVETDPETGIIRTRKPRCHFVTRFFSRVFLESLSLCFIAEWGDRSQLTTIVLAARENIAGVAIGGLIGHFICTGIAVLGGRMIAQRISIRTVTLVGGLVFIGFALSALIANPEQSLSPSILL